MTEGQVAATVTRASMAITDATCALGRLDALRALAGVRMSATDRALLDEAVRDVESARSHMQGVRDAAGSEAVRCGRG